MAIEEGSIIQITNDKHHWFPCLVIVSEVKGFGCQGYITMPNNKEEPNGNAYIRLNEDDYEEIGKKAILVAG